MIGDIQSSVFSPLRIFFNLCPSIQTWNWMLMSELALCSISTYVLARFLRIDRIASLFAALMYTFCPFNMWFLELNLGTASCIFPLTFLLFARAARLQTVASYVGAGVGSAFLILSGHPESAFFGIIFGALLMLCMVMLDSTKTAGDLRRFGVFMRGLSIAGLTALALTAPVLFPFVEYLCNSETYKYVSYSSASIPWQGIVQHLLNASSGPASPFLGIVTAICLPVAVLVPFRKNCNNRVESTSLILIAIAAFLITSQLGHLHSLFCQPPMTTIITRYCLPVLLLICSLLASMSLSHLFAKQPSQLLNEKNCKPEEARLPSRLDRFRVIVLAASALIALGLPFLLQNNTNWLQQCSFDSMLPPPGFNFSGWKRDCICALSVVALASLVPFSQTRLKKPQSIIAALYVFVLVAALVSIGTAAKNSLPKQQAFNYPLVEPLADIRSEQWRALSTQEHLFRAGTNVVYGIQDLRAHNPLFPKRYLSLIKACGAKVDLFNQNFDRQISPLLGITSTKYILSQLPVERKGAEEQSLKNARPVVGTPLNFRDQLTLADGTFWSAGTAAGGKLTWKLSGTAGANNQQLGTITANSDRTGTFTFAPVLFNQAGNVIWFGDQTPIQNSQTYNVPIPVEIVKAQNKVRLGIQVFDNKANAFLLPSNCSIEERANRTANLVEFVPAPEMCSPLSPHLVKECPGHIRLYENARALPRAYVVYEAKLVLAPEQALSQIQSPQFAPHREVVIEAEPRLSSAGTHYENLRKLAESQAAQPERTKLSSLEVMPPAAPRSDNFTEARIEQIGPNQVHVSFNAKSAGYLVLTDVFYPGWKAYIDGAEIPILRANYAFRAVLTPQGEHTIDFKYDPLSFKLGVCCFALFLIALIAASARRFIR